MSTTRRVQGLAVRAYYHGLELVRVHETDPFNPGVCKLAIRRPNSRTPIITDTVDKLEDWLDTQEQAA